jgi:hypothetical protein
MSRPGLFGYATEIFGKRLPRGKYSLALVLIAASWAGAAEPSVRLSTTTAELGKPVSAVAVAPANLEPDLARSTTDLYTIALAGEPKPVADGKEWPLQILPLAVGKLPVDLYFKDAPAPVRVNLTVTEPPNLPPEADVSDIKAPARAKPRLWPWLLALALLIAAYYAWRRWKARPEAGAPAAPPDLRTPAERALEELGALEASPLWGEGRYKDFYFELTEILRAYLERRFGVPALKLTTYELARQLRALEAERQAVSLFKELFDRADLVKFAKTTPEGGQGALDLAGARRLVELTAPRDLAPAPPAAPGGGATR